MPDPLKFSEIEGEASTLATGEVIGVQEGDNVRFPVSLWTAITDALQSALTALTAVVAGKVANDDARLTNARTPTGAAGGVLGGTYPNPSFAADMATQAELDAGLAAKVGTSDARLTDSRTPTGAAGGVLAGTYPNPTFLEAMATQSGLDSLALATSEGLADKVDLTDPRLTDARETTGAAGGVLSGSFPDPTFAEDMATQAELNAALALKLSLTGGTMTGALAQAFTAGFASALISGAVNGASVYDFKASLVSFFNGANLVSFSPKSNGFVLTGNAGTYLTCDNVSLIIAQWAQSDYYIQGPNGGNGNTNRPTGNVVLRSGLPTGNASGGSVILATSAPGASGTAERASVSRLIVDTHGVVQLINATTVPASNPVGGGYLYSEGGALKWRSPAGTVTTIAPN